MVRKEVLINRIADVFNNRGATIFPFIISLGPLINDMIRLSAFYHPKSREHEQIFQAVEEVRKALAELEDGYAHLLKAATFFNEVIRSEKKKTTKTG